MSQSGPPSSSITTSMARWTFEGWAGRAPLRPIFWGGGAIWFIGFFIQRGIVHLFLLPQSPYAVQVSATMNMLMRASEWILMGVFIWWCVAVWRCAAAEPVGVWPTTAKGFVALLVIANAISSLMTMTR